MTILKLVKGKFEITQVTRHADGSRSVLMEVKGLDYEDVQSLKEIQKLGLALMFVPDPKDPKEESFSMGYRCIPQRGGHGEKPRGPKPKPTPRPKEKA